MCLGQHDETVIKNFNKNKAAFLNVEFGKPLPESILIDSTKREKVPYSFDKKKHLEERCKFKNKSFGYDAGYYVFQLDGNVHLIQIQYRDIDSTHAKKILDTLGILLLPVHFYKGPDLFYFENEFCTPLCWVKYDADKKKTCCYSCQMHIIVTAWSFKLFIF